MGMVAASAHHIGRTKSAARPNTAKISQNIFRSMGQVYIGGRGAVLSAAPYTCGRLGRRSSRTAKNPAAIVTRFNPTITK